MQTARDTIAASYASLSRRRLIGGALSAAALSVLPAGCGRRSATGSGRGADGKITIRFWNGFTGPDGKTMEALVKRFQAANPDVAVKMQIIPWGTYYDKLTLSLAYGGAPDVFVTHAARLPEFAEYEALRPLADFYASDTTPLQESDFAPIPWQGSFYKSVQYGLPLDVHPLGLYYNTDLFKKAGIVDANGDAKPLRTGDEFLDAAKRLTRDTDGDGQPDEWGFVYTYQHTNFITFAAQWGGGILTPDLSQSAMDSPATIAAARYMSDLIYKHQVAPRPEGVDAWLAFRQGKAAMAMEGIYMLASLEEQKDLAYAGAPVPQFGPQPGAWGGSHVLAMPGTRGGTDGDENTRRAAWRLMRFLSDNSLSWAEGGQVPARVAIRDSPAFAALPVQSAFARQLDHIVYDPLTPKANALGPFVDPAIESVLLNLDTSPNGLENALHDASRRINQVLKRP